MDNTQRGLIRNRHRGTQCHDFSGLRFGNITATDIDGLIEYKDKAFVFIEVKYHTTDMPFGQRLALERLCDNLGKQKPTICIIASHRDDGDIDVAQSQVRMFRYKGKWRTGSGTTRKLVCAFLSSVTDFEEWGNYHDEQ